MLERLQKYYEGGRLDADKKTLAPSQMQEYPKKFLKIGKICCPSASGLFLVTFENSVTRRLP